MEICLMKIGRRANAYAVWKTQKLTNDDIDRIREDNILEDFLYSLGRSDLVNIYINLSDEEKEKIKRKIIIDGHIKIIYLNKNSKPTEDINKHTNKHIELNKRIAIINIEIWHNILTKVSLNELLDVAHSINEMLPQQQRFDVTKDNQISR